MNRLPGRRVTLNVIFLFFFAEKLTFLGKKCQVLFALTIFILECRLLFRMSSATKLKVNYRPVSCYKINTLCLWKLVHVCWTVFLTERIPHAGVINSTEFFTFGQRWRIRFADLEFLTQTSLSHIRIYIACSPVNNFLMNGNILGEI